MTSTRVGCFLYHLGIAKTISLKKKSIFEHFERELYNNYCSCKQCIWHIGHLFDEYGLPKLNIYEGPISLLLSLYPYVLKFTGGSVHVMLSGSLNYIPECKHYLCQLSNLSWPFSTFGIATDL